MCSVRGETEELCCEGKPERRSAVFRTEKDATKRLPWWPSGTGCRTASDQEICELDAKARGLCGTLMAHGRVCVEQAGECPVHKTE